MWVSTACTGDKDDTLDGGEGTHEEDGECVADTSDTSGSDEIDPEGSAIGECSDGFDNDLDGYTDCEDQDFFGNPECDDTDTEG